MPWRNDKEKIVSVILIALAFNAFSFTLAFTETFKPVTGAWARDFSAYYIGEWRLFHNPSTIYWGAVQPGDYNILPASQTFKYTPSFLILFAPFLALSYQNALTIFDIIQFALIPLLAFFVYKIVKEKDLFFASLAAVTVLIQPLPTPPLNSEALNSLQLRFFSLSLQPFSPPYYISYALANAHVLQVTLLVGALYFGFTKKPLISALLFSLGAFDPRGALVAIPLLVFYNRKKIVTFIAGATSFLALTNLPFFFYNNIGYTFLQTETRGSIISLMYPYDWLPLYAVLALTLLEILDLSRNTKCQSCPLKTKT